MASDPFVHLHLHSEYSLLDGLSRVEEMVGQAAKLGMPAMALTDHGVLYGAIDFYQYAKAKGIKPIIGVEAYIAPRGMTDRASQDRQYSHLVLLARDNDGYQNLLKLVTRSHLEGYYYRPRIDRDLLASHAKGLIALSACPSGEVARGILRDDLDAAREAANAYREIMGPDGFWLELQAHGLVEPNEAKIMRAKLQLSRETGIPVVATNDVHYTNREGARGQDMLLCIQTNSTLDDPKRMRMERDEFYIKSGAEMRQLFGEIPEALTNTLAIADQCHLELKFDRLNFPELSHVIPHGVSPQDHLGRLCREALPGRYPGNRDKAAARLEYELDVIGKTGFAAYILFVWDFVRWARAQDILCGPRGSAAGAIVLYLLGITQVDPLEYGLTFERFLNPERVQMPDIDMDFPDDKRDLVIEHVVQQYGRDRVAQIVTFGRLLARAAIRDVGRALAYPISEVDRVAKMIPTIPIGVTIAQALEANKEFQALYDSQPQVKRLVDAARSVEGVARHASTHAAGVVVSGDPLVEVVPLQKVAKTEGAVMTQYHMKSLEKIGLLKMDFLGLANLTMLDKAVQFIREVRGVTIDLNNLPLDDQRTYDAQARCESRTVFQLEGSGMTRYLKELKPTSVHHLAAMVALYRPGPMAQIPEYIARKEGRKRVEYPHPSLEPVLNESYGLIVYQDQVLQVVQIVAGYTLGQADILRRAMGKNLPEEMKRERARFLEGAANKGYREEVANQLWEYIEPFAGYAFNKSHAVMYAYIAFQTAYLKANFPVEWMAAVLTTEALNTEKVVGVVGECRRLGIQVSPPDVNRSQARFTVETIPTSALEMRLGIRYGLAAIKNVGEGAVDLIIAERGRGGPFKALDDFCRRVDLKTINKRVIESLVKAGALDQFGERERLLAGVDQCMAVAQQAQKASSLGQTSLFDLGGGADSASTSVELPRVDAVPERERLLWEKETLGLYLSTHPFQTAALALESVVSASIADLGPDTVGQKFILAGIVVSVRRLTTKKGDSMSVAEVEDLTGTVEVIAFPRTLEKTTAVWHEDVVVILEGKLEQREDRLQIICESARAWNEADAAEAQLLSARPGGGAARDGRATNRPKPRSEQVNGSRNGHTNGTSPEIRTSSPANGREGSGNSQASVAAAGIAVQGSPRSVPAATNAAAIERPRVRIVVPRHGHPVEDVRLLEAVHALLRDHPGDDRYELELSAGRRRVLISGPASTFAWSAALEADLRALVGRDNLQGFELPPIVEQVASTSPDTASAPQMVPEVSAAPVSRAAEPFVDDDFVTSDPGTHDGWSESDDDEVGVSVQGMRAADDLDSVRNWWG